jgi:hypothetical protein
MPRSRIEFAQAGEKAGVGREGGCCHSQRDHKGYDELHDGTVAIGMTRWVKGIAE